MYQALYRKYRPSTFSEVVGQEHVTKTLMGELSMGKIFHAYLFTGTRGTGKTSCAKILAKAVNCENLKGGDPCGECASCKNIASGEVMDIVEIDAASNNGVDDVRLLREQAVFTPASAKYRVYIIDEVHMLSKPAFNALLKTLEEPPAHVVFILATTEVQELPATILSRCQRFDFTRIDANVIKNRLLYVAKNEGLNLDENAASLVAALSDGCMRDALSLLDLCAGSGGEITEKTVEKCCGMTGREHVNQLVDCIKNQDSSQALALVDKLYSASVDTKRLCNDLISHFRDLMIVKSVRDSGSLIVCSDVQHKTYNEQAKEFSMQDIMSNLDVLQNALQRLKGTTARCEMEMALVKMCTPQLKSDVASLEARIAALENGVATPKVTPKTAKVEYAAPAPKPQVLSQPASAVEEEIPSITEQDAPPEFDVQDVPFEETAQEPTASEPTEVRNFSWSAVLAQLMKNAPLLYGILNGSTAKLSGSVLEIDAPNGAFWELLKSDTNHQKRIDDAIFAVCGQKFTLKKATLAKKSDVDPLAAFDERLKNFSLQENVIYESKNTKFRTK